MRAETLRAAITLRPVQLTDSPICQINAHPGFVRDPDLSSLAPSKMNTHLRTAAIALFVVFSSIISAYAGPLEGMWKNVDNNTRSILRIRVFADAQGSPMLEFWSKAGDTEPKTGPFAFTLLGDSAFDKEPNKHAYARNDVFIPNRPLKFCEDILFITSSGDELIVEYLRIYNKGYEDSKGVKDNVERSNKRERLVLKKQ